MKSCLHDNYIEIYSTHREGISVVTERFIRTLKNKIYKYMTSISKNAYIDKLNNKVNNYNNGYHSTTKVKFLDVKSNTYIDFNNKLMKKILNLSNHVRITKYKNIFAKCYVPSWNEEDFVIKSVFSLGMFYNKDLQKINPTKFGTETLIKKEGDKLKWKSYNNSFKAWIDRQDIVI